MIGIDVIDINRFSKLSKGDFSHWDNVFTKSEWEYGFSAPNPARALAGIFSAKESVMKSVGNELMEQFSRIQICHEASGKPIIKIESKKQDNIHISISHSNNTAVSVAIQL